MMFNKISLKRLLAFLAVLIMAASVSLTAFAADDDDYKEPAGMPIINVISGNVYEIEPGQETNIALRVRNTSTSVAKSVVVIPTVENASDNPLKVTLNAQSSNIGTISANGERTINLTVAADRTAATKTYAINIKFQFLNNDGVSYDSTSTIYFKIKNASGVPVFNFQNYKLNPAALNAGDSAALTFELFNKGPLNMYNAVVSLENLDSAGVGVNGSNQKKFSKIWAGTKENLSFNLTTNSAMEDGSYPVTVKVVFNDENGTEHTYEEKYFVSVGAGNGKNADLRIENVKEPSGVFGVNQNFDFTFTVKNYGDAAAENIRISAAEYGEGGNIVPKSNSTYSLKELLPGKTADYKFTFAPTGNASSRNYTVEFKLEYKMGGKDYTITQYGGANVTNPDKDEEDGEKKESKPKIIVSEYNCDPVIVMAGENFDLTMTFLNTHVEKAVKNVKMFLTMVEETSSENEKSGNVFTPVDSSNTFYYDSIAPKGTVSKTMTLYTVPSAQPKTYTLTVNFEYEDESGNEYTATELLGINVKQVSQVDTSEMFIPETAEIGMPINVYFDIYNTGKVDISNLKVSLEGDITTQNKSTYIGNCSPGDSNYYEGNFSVNNMGLNNFKLIISYDDPSGEQIQQVKEYTINGTEPVMDDSMGGDMMMPDDMDAGQGLSLKAKIGIGVGTVVGIVIIVIALKLIKKRKDAKLLADDLDDDMEGKDENEQL